MPRIWKRKTKTGQQTPSDVMEKALELCLAGRSIREVSKALKIPNSTLHRYVSNAKEKGVENIRLTPNYANKKVFSETEETELTEYLLSASKLCFGLTTKLVRELALQYANANGISVPKPWNDNQMAGYEWLIGFLRRQPRLSIRKPEATSMNRATNFNQRNVQQFYDNLEKVLTEFQFEPSDIYNCDETGMMTVHIPSKVVADKKLKQVGKLTSGERGSLVTLIGAINAIGNSIPPYFIFPRVNFKLHMLRGSPSGSDGAANQSGWINSEIFVKWLDHFIMFSKASLEKQVLLILDNHDSHVSIPAIEKARENGIVLLTLPPHTSHKLQPLDRSVYGPLKKFYNSGCDSWLMRNPGQRITIYEVAELAGQAYNRAMTPENITSGFRTTGIFPFDRYRFPELQNNDAHDADATGDRPTTEHPLDKDNEESASSNEVTSSHKSPEMIRPLIPLQSVVHKTPRRKRFVCSKILTNVDTNQQGQDLYESQTRQLSGPRKKIRIAKVHFHNDVPADDEIEIASLGKEDEDKEKCDVGKHVLVRYRLNGTSKFFVGYIEAKVDELYEVSFMKKQTVSFMKIGLPYSFLFPEKKDVDWIDEDDIVRVLPSPMNAGGSSRAANTFTFPNVDFAPYF